MPDYPPQQQPVAVQQGYAIKPANTVIAPGPQQQVIQVPQQQVIQGPQEWTQTLCGCGENMEICCEEFWCAYCHLGFMYGYLETGLQNMDALACCGTCLVDSLLLGGIARCLVIMHLRDRITARYGIREDGCKNCCVSCCCSCCASCQMHREMDVRRDYTGGCCYKAPMAPPPMQASYPAQTGYGGQPQYVQQQQPVNQPGPYQSAPYAGQPQPAYESKV